MKIDEIAPPYSPPLCTPSRNAMADTGLIAYVRGTAMAIAVGALMPGIAPTTIPSDHTEHDEREVERGESAGNACEDDVHPRSGQRRREQCDEEEPQRDRSGDGGDGERHALRLVRGRGGRRRARRRR